jgi:hypothetical protein
VLFIKASMTRARFCCTGATETIYGLGLYRMGIHGFSNIIEVVHANLRCYCRVFHSIGVENPV